MHVVASIQLASVVVITRVSFFRKPTGNPDITSAPFNDQGKNAILGSDSASSQLGYAGSQLSVGGWFSEWTAQKSGQLC